MISTSRTPEFMADAAHIILTSDKSVTGAFFIDETVLRAAGRLGWTPYAKLPGPCSLLRAPVPYPDSPSVSPSRALQRIATRWTHPLSSFHSAPRVRQATRTSPATRWCRAPRTQT